MNILISCLFPIIVSAFFNKIEPFKEESPNMTALEMIKFHGYPAMQYKVTTDDGYILTVHRIPGKKGTSLKSSL